MLYYFRDKARYWSKIAIFFITIASTPQLGVPVGLLSYGTVWCTKKKQNGVAIGLPDGVKIEYALSTEYRRISACDGCTDRHLASATAFSALYIASRGKNRT